MIRTVAGGELDDDQPDRLIGRQAMQRVTLGRPRSYVESVGEATRRNPGGPA